MGTSGGSARIWIGVILILFGAIFLLENFFFLPFHIPNFLRHWQWILVLIGIVILLTHKNRTGGIVLISLGLFFLYGFKLLLPLMLVGLGFYFVIKRGADNRLRSNLNGSENEPGSYFFSLLCSYQLIFFSGLYLAIVPFFIPFSIDAMGPF